MCSKTAISLNSMSKPPGGRNSERRLIEAIRRWFPARRRDIRVGIGDDAMVLRNGTAISTDSFIEGVHFEFKYFSKYDLGYRAMAASLSDLAAMKAVPVCALIALYLPRSVRSADLRQLYRGFRALLVKYGADIAGGDITESRCWAMTITVIGIAKSPLLRSGARPGQLLFSTGHLGLSEVGRQVLRCRLDRRKFPAAVARHLRPEPKFREAKALGRGATAGIDTSDGLSTDAWHLGQESGVKIVIESARIKIHPEVRTYCLGRGIDPIRHILDSGEDFELLFTASRLAGGIKDTAHRIGYVEKGAGLYLVAGGKCRRLKPSGYEHLK